MCIPDLYRKVHTANEGTRFLNIVISMEKRDYTVEDFVLDQQFRKWVIEPDLATMDYWERFMETHPEKRRDMAKARKFLLNLSRVNHEVTPSDLVENWNKVLEKVAGTAPEEKSGKSVYLHSKVALDFPRNTRGYQSPMKNRWKIFGFLSIATVLAIAVFMLGLQSQVAEPTEEIKAVPEWVSFEAPKGTKTVVSLHDGSKVTLNSGSSIRYAKHFEGPLREVFLSGEALFEVAKKPEKAFVVTAGGMETVALGTIFNIKAFADMDAQVSLLEGSVGVSALGEMQTLLLHPGEAVRKPSGKDALNKEKFDTEEVMAWTNKTLYFKNTLVRDVVRDLENWYGVEIAIGNNVPSNLRVTGKYHDQTLRNVLEGLSYSANFEYQMTEDKVNLKFKP